MNFIHHIQPVKILIAILFGFFVLCMMPSFAAASAGADGSGSGGDEGTPTSGAGSYTSSSTWSSAVDTTWTVPSGVTEVKIKVWGAGGGGGYTGTAPSARGGGGGYAEGVLSVIPGQVLDIDVGTGGIGGSLGVSGGGGGLSRVASGSVAWIIGGSGAGGSSYNANITSVAHGGAGGGVEGYGGIGGQIGLVDGGDGGSAGTSTGGGLGGENLTAGTNGSLYTGGAGGDGSASEGGDGGAGYYGGGGGSGGGAGAGGGGGGSSYVISSATASSTEGGDNTSTSSAHTSDVHFVSEAGFAGDGTLSGSDGLIIIYYTLPADSEGPLPSTMSFSVAPDDLTTASIDMTSVTATDATSTPISYLFDAVTGSCGSDLGTGGTDSSWQTSTSYTDTGLQTNKCYSYTIQARDSQNNANTTSSASSTYTAAEVPTVSFKSIGSSNRLIFDGGNNSTANPTTYYSAQIVNTSPADATWEDKYIDSGGSPNGSAQWLSESQLHELVLNSLTDETQYTVQIKARNADLEETGYAYATTTAEFWSGSVQITIGSDNVDDDLTNFPVYVDLADMPTDFWSNTNTGCTEVRVTESDEYTELPREIVSCTNGSSSGELHFKASTVSSTTDTVFWVHYGNSSVGDYASTSEFGSQKVWSNDYLAVWHMEEDPSVTNPQDSSSNENHIVTVGAGMTTADSVSSKIENGLDFDGASTDILTTPTLNMGGDFSISYWMNPTRVHNYGDPFGRENRISFATYSTGRINFSIGNGASWGPGVSSAVGELINGEDTYVTGTYDGSDARLYLDGFEEGNASGAGYTVSGANYYIGSRIGQAYYMEAEMDEFRVSTTTRSAAWIAAEYTNQKDTLSFYSIDRDVAKVWNATDWSLYDTITIDAEQVDDDLTDFPVYVDLADLSTQFWNTTPTSTTYVGSDIRITTDAESPVELPRELVTASGTAQTGELHFKADSVSSTTDTVFRVYYNGTTTLEYKDSDTYGAENVWSNDYIAVWHLQEDPNGMAPQAKDSTGLGGDATNLNGMTSADLVSSKLENGLDFDGGATDHLTTPNLNLGTEFTASFWMNPNNLHNYGSAFGSPSRLYFLTYADGSMAYNVGNGSGYGTDLYTSAGVFTNDTDFYLTGTYDGSNARLYTNGSLYDTQSNIGYDLGTGSYTIGNTNGHYIESDLDEVRVASTTRSAAWIAAEYENQKETRSFYSINGSGYDSYSVATSTETWIVPENVSEITVKAWGGGGGAYSTLYGGAGGFMQGAVAVTPGEELTLRVAGGGTGGAYGGGGGGYSGLFRGSDPLIVAAGGGGASYSVAVGGAGGGLAGVDGGDQSAGDGGHGGTQSAGGAGGVDTTNGEDGSYLQGGGGAGYTGAIGTGLTGGLNGGGNAGNSYGAGGGGGGYYGGGGGARYYGGGGGGSSFATSTASATSTTAGSGSSPGNSSDEDYATGAAVGGTSSSDGGDGRLVITYEVDIPTVVNLIDSDGGQVSNTFNFTNKTDAELFAFKLSSTTDSVTVDELIVRLEGASDFITADLANVELYIDVNNDAVYDNGTDTLVGAGTVSVSGQSGTITFSTDFSVAGAINYLVIGDTVSISRGGSVTFALYGADITAIGSIASGTVSTIQHYRRSSSGGNYRGGGDEIGGDAPEGDGDVGGGTNEGGALIGSDPNFSLPTANAGSWTTPANAYDNTDGTYATAASGVTNNFTSHGFSVPGSNQIDGIEVKLEVSGTTAAGDIGVELSWDTGSSWTSTGYDTSTLTTTDAVVTLGSPSNTWGRAWSASEFSNANFAVRVTGNPSSNTVQIDAIQVSVYHAATGGGGGGGGEI